MVAAWKKLEAKNPLLYEKELLPVGDVVPFVDGKNEAVPVQVELPYLQNIVNNFKKFVKNGIRVPLFKSHVEDADNDRGTVEDLEIRKNSKGVDSLFGKIRFHDKLAARKGTRVDVSVLCPPRFRDGKGRVYSNPLRHVALTSVPVYPGLESWKGPLILSFDTPSGLMLAEAKQTTDGSVQPPEGGDNMSELIDQILEALGITAPEGADDGMKLKLILQEVSDTGDGADLGDLALSFPPIVQTALKGAREGEIDALVRESVITPARAAEWKKQYCTDDLLQTDLRLSASNAEKKTEVKSEFEKAVALARTLAGDRPLRPEGRTLLKLSQASSEDGNDNPLMADAKKRADKKKAKTA